MACKYVSEIQPKSKSPLQPLQEDRKEESSLIIKEVLKQK